MSSGPHHQVPLTQAQIAQQQQAAAIQVEMAKRRSRKPTDKNLPDNIDDCTVGDMATRYRELRDFERRLDATITRKRLDIVDSVNRSVKVRDTRRLWTRTRVGPANCGLAMEDPSDMAHQYCRGSGLAREWSQRRHL